MKKNSLNYKQMLERAMPVTFDCVDVEDGHEVERLWLADMVDSKWAEDYVTINRITYDTVTDEEGAVFAVIDNGLMLVKAVSTLGISHIRKVIMTSFYRKISEMII